MINESFIKGYGVPLNMDFESITRRKIYSLIFNIIDAYVCMAEYNNGENSQMNKNAAIGFLDQLLYFKIFVFRIT